MKNFIVTTVFLFCVFYSGNGFAQISGTYAIVNAQTGLSLRPMGASSRDGNKIIMFTTIEWKCETWDFQHVKGNAYALENLYTFKSFQPADERCEAGVGIVQYPLNKTNSKQQWEFEEITEGLYKIKLLGSDLYLTTTDSEEKNSSVFLEKKKDTKTQQWRLVAQSPKG